jgi:hypothetical protein
MTNKPEGAPGISFMDNARAPDIFADGASGVFLFGGNLRITLESLRCSHISSPGPLNRVVIGRLILPLAAAENLRNLLVDYLGRLKANPDAPPPQGTPTIN